MSRLPIVGVMGSGTRTHLGRASALGRWLAECGVHLLTGGGAGAMAAVSKAFHETPDRRGMVIGILPCAFDDFGTSPVQPKEGYPNPWVEIPVQTHLPLSGERGTELLSRNHVNVLTSDVVVALSGDGGTLSEVELAVRYERPVIAFVESDREIPGLPMSVPVVSSLEGVQKFVMTRINGP
jgi:uncharacterized protein (TIGR00725 family)